VALTMGFALSLSRQRPEIEMREELPIFGGAR
jgi:hypothetical protein